MSSFGTSSFGTGSFAGASAGGTTYAETITSGFTAGAAGDALLLLSIADGTAFGDAGLANLTLRVRELIAANAAVITEAELAETVTEGLTFSDLAQLVHRLLVTEGFTLDGDAAAQFTAMHVVADTLRLSGVVASRLEAMQLVTSGIAFGVLVDMYAKAAITEGLAVQGAVTTALTAALRLVESILAGGIPANTMIFGAVVREELALAIDTGTVLDALAVVRDGVALALRINAEGDERIAYLINTENKALTRFTGWPFNSYARMGARGAYYGMTPDGVRRVFDGATTDDGAAIGARIRLAMTNLGTSREKRMTHAYLGYTASGELRLRAIVVGRDGEKEAYTYRLREQGAGAHRPARIGIGQGLKSVYWGFELEAIDGAAFELDLLQLLPLVLEGRLNGEGGGLR